MKCQKCRQTLRLHGSLEDMSPAAFNLLLGSSSTPADSLQPTKQVYPSSRNELYEKALQSSSSIPHKRSSTASSSRTNKHSSTSKSLYGNTAESFVVLTESQVTLPPPPSSRNDSSKGDISASATEVDKDSFSHLQRSENLFEILSARTDVDHPVCKECSELIVEAYDKRLKGAEKERDAFIKLLKTVERDIPNEAEQEVAQKELERLEAEEAAAITELKALETEKSQVDAEIKALEAEAAELSLEEEEFWRARNTFAQKLDEFQNERDSVNIQYDHDTKQLEKLQRTNVYNDTFCIGHDGYFGTINGLRLGRLPNQAVEWTEINAAWGQTLLLLATIAEKLGFTFEGYRLKPMGSTSRIDKIDPSAPDQKPQTFELFSSGDLPIGRMFMHRRFDQAMVAFLDCLKQLGEFVEKRDPDMKLPYPIVKDKIGDSCIRLAFNQNEAWTRACKYTLTCVKFLLAHTR